jgi:hypothetical protein
MDLTCPIRCQDDEGRRGRPQGSELGNGDLELGQQFQKESFEFFVSSVDFVDQQNRRPRPPRIDGLEQWPLDQERFTVECTVRAGPVERVRGVEDPQLEQLSWIIPLVQRVADVEPFIALQADEIGTKRGCDSRGKRRLPDPRFSLEEQRAFQAKGQEQRDREAAVGDIVLVGQALLKI